MVDVRRAAKCGSSSARYSAAVRIKPPRSSQCIILPATFQASGGGISSITSSVAPGFITRARVGYVVIDLARTPLALREFAIDAYRLVKIGQSDGYELYVPTVSDTADAAP